MAKTKLPFFSLGSQGSVGGSITTQKRNQDTLVRSKPFPTDPYSLPQAYQRWLYQAYAYLWTQQSAATRAAYRAAGSRFHLTGLQFWMKDMLSRLPDIVAFYHLDTGETPTAIDFSKNANHGTIFGASPADGIIDGGLYFDGLNDYIQLTSVITIADNTPWTLELFRRHFSQLTTWTFLTGNLFVPGSYARIGSWQPNANQLSFGIWNDANVGIDWTIPIAPTWEHTTLVCDGTDLNNFELFLDDVSQGIRTLPDSSQTIRVLGAVNTAPNYPFKGDLDHIILYNRALNQTEVTRHSLRRYPS